MNSIDDPEKKFTYIADSVPYIIYLTTSLKRCQCQEVFGEVQTCSKA